MKKLILMLAAASTLAFGAQVYEGVITDTMCGANHAHMGVSPDAKCVKECVKGSNGKYKYALLVGTKMYVLSDQATPEQYAAAMVKVTGTLYEKTGILKVDKIEAAK